MNFSFWGYFSSNYPYIFPFFHPIFYTLPFHISPHQPYFPLPGVGGDFQNTGPWVRYKDKIEFFFLIIKKNLNLSSAVSLYLYGMLPKKMSLMVKYFVNLFISI